MIARPCPVKIWEEIPCSISPDTTRYKSTVQVQVYKYVTHLDLVDFDQKVFATARTQYV